MTKGGGFTPLNLHGISSATSPSDCRLTASAHVNRPRGTQVNRIPPGMRGSVIYFIVNCSIIT
ncbi:unnamed protein product, partial [Nesidiocoris tenuis]